jgi:hypothetical protein
MPLKQLLGSATATLLFTSSAYFILFVYDGQFKPVLLSRASSARERWHGSNLYSSKNQQGNFDTPALGFGE